MDQGVVRYSMEERRELLVEALAKVQYPVLPSVAFDDLSQPQPTAFC
jgi:hypothetical protein